MLPTELSWPRESHPPSLAAVSLHAIERARKMILDLSEAIPTVVAQAPALKKFLDLCDAARPDRPLRQSPKIFLDLSGLTPAQASNRCEPEKCSWSYPRVLVIAGLPRTRKMFLDLNRNPAVAATTKMVLELSCDGHEVIRVSGGERTLAAHRMALFVAAVPLQ